MKVYAIGGLGADERVFQNLHLPDHELIPIPWIRPNDLESIIDYSQRLVAEIHFEKPFAIIGVSFGGLIAVELSKQLNPSKTILISSVEKRSEMPLIYRLFGKTRLIRLIPSSMLFTPKPIIRWLFKAQNKTLLNAILDDTDKHFLKWSLDALMTWQNQDPVERLINITGSEDYLFPLTESDKRMIVKGGGHFMIVDKGEEVSSLVNEILSKKSRYT